MKTTLELPDNLIRAIKVRALNDRRKLKDTVADLLIKGLGAPQGEAAAASQRVKLPLVKCKQSASLSPERVARILLEQDVEWHS